MCRAGGINELVHTRKATHNNGVTNVGGLSKWLSGRLVKRPNGELTNHRDNESPHVRKLTHKKKGGT